MVMAIVERVHKRFQTQIRQLQGQGAEVAEVAEEELHLSILGPISLALIVSTVAGVIGACVCVCVHARACVCVCVASRCGGGGVGESLRLSLLVSSVADVMRECV